MFGPPRRSNVRSQTVAKQEPAPRASMLSGDDPVLDELLERHAVEQWQARRREFEKDRLLDELLVRRLAVDYRANTPPPAAKTSLDTMLVLNKSRSELSSRDSLAARGQGAGSTARSSLYSRAFPEHGQAYASSGSSPYRQFEDPASRLPSEEVTPPYAASTSSADRQFMTASRLPSEELVQSGQAVPFSGREALPIARVESIFKGSSSGDTPSSRGHEQWQPEQLAAGRDGSVSPSPLPSAGGWSSAREADWTGGQPGLQADGALTDIPGSATPPPSRHHATASALAAQALLEASHARSASNSTAPSHAGADRQGEEGGADAGDAGSKPAAGGKVGAKGTEKSVRGTAELSSEEGHSSTDEGGAAFVVGRAEDAAAKDSEQLYAEVGLRHNGSMLSADALENASAATVSKEVFKRYDLDCDGHLNKFEYGLLMRDIAHDVTSKDDFVTAVSEMRFRLTLTPSRVSCLRRLLLAPPTGSICTVEGCLKKAKLNGRRCRVKSVKRDGMVEVCLPGGQKDLLPPGNLIWDD